MEKVAIQSRLAVLIDADNAQSGLIQPLLAEVANYGIASVKRAYGDWTTGRLSGWKQVLNEHAIQPIQQFSYTTGKNSTDSALIIDAMDLLYTGHLQGFCIVSSDSDFTRLATRLRESGLKVYGFGEQKTPRPFVSSCDRFIYTEILTPAAVDEGASPAKPARSASPAKELRADTRLVNLLRQVVQSAADEDGWSYLATVGQHIANNLPDFDSRNYGYAKLGQLIDASGLFEIQVRETPSGQKQKYVRGRQAKKRNATIEAAS